MNNFLRQRVRLSIVGVCTLLWALTANSAQLSTKQLETIIAERFPNTIVEGVYSSTDLPGFYEVVTPEEIAYVDGTGTRLIMGNIMDIETRSSLTTKRWNELHRIDFQSLPFDKAIKNVQGDGSRKIAIFEDPFCPYCAELEKSLRQLDNVTIYVFLYPLEEVHPGATEAANDLWCAHDHSTAWVAWMRDEKSPIKTHCADSPVEELVNLGKQLKIHSTPTLFFQDGLRVAGALEVEQINKKLVSLSDKVAP
ncbi:MAG: DsbC family protein [Steroidobacteraceae bacterium]